MNKKCATNTTSTWQHTSVKQNKELRISGIKKVQFFFLGKTKKVCNWNKKGTTGSVSMVSFLFLIKCGSTIFFAVQKKISCFAFDWNALLPFPTTFLGIEIIEKKKISCKFYQKNASSHPRKLIVLIGSQTHTEPHARNAREQLAIFLFDTCELVLGNLEHIKNSFFQ